MPAPANLVHETATTTGTGNFTLTAVNGKQRFSTAFSTGGTTNVFDYFISNRDAAEWERGTGHMSAVGTLVRDTVLESTNANALVNFSAGTKDVSNDVPAGFYTFASQAEAEAGTENSKLVSPLLVAQALDGGDLSASLTDLDITIPGSSVSGFATGRAFQINDTTTSQEPSAHIYRLEVIDATSVEKSSAFFVRSTGFNNVVSQTQAVFGQASKEGTSTGDVVGIYGDGNHFGPQGTAFGAFFAARASAGAVPATSAIAVQTETQNGTGIAWPYNKAEGAQNFTGIDLNYAGSVGGSTLVPSGAAVIIRAQPSKWDVGIGIPQGDNIETATIQDDSSAETMWLATEGSHAYGINWTAATFSANAIATPGFAVGPLGAVTVPDEVYDATDWNGDLTVPTKNAIRDKIEALAANVRERLTTNRTYYVRTDGSNSNTGLVDSAGGAFLTIQKAYDTIVQTLDVAGYAVEIDVGNGTYSASGAALISVVAPWFGGGSVTFTGDITTPANVILSATSADAISIVGEVHGTLTVRGFKITTITAGNCIVHTGVGTVYVNSLDFGAAGGGYYHIFCASNMAIVFVNGNYSITGGAGYHWAAQAQGAIKCFGRTVTITGTPAFSVAFATANRLAFIEAYSNTYTGSATGVRYTVAENSVIFTNGARATALPGNSAGSSATGGQYT